MDQPLVSVIIPTRNCASLLRSCLLSVQRQTYANIEIIVVDGNSIDDTREVAKQYTSQVFVYSKKGDHRSAQRNLGVEKSLGRYVLLIDSDMELGVRVIESCVEKVSASENTIGVIIPEESFGIGLWAECKKLERSFYQGVEWMEAGRFFRKDIYLQVGGYDETMVSGEDWDLSQRAGSLGKMERIEEFILHNEGHISLLKTVKKKFYYAKKISMYINKNKSRTHLKNQMSIWKRYAIFFFQPKKLFKNPILGMCMLWMKTCEFGFGGLGFMCSKIKI